MKSLWRCIFIGIVEKAKVRNKTVKANTPDNINCGSSGKIESYYALILAILKGYTTEDALHYLETGEKPDKKNRFNTTNDIVDMIKMKFEEDMTFQEIAEIYNSSASSICLKFKRLRERKDTEDMRVMREAGFTYQEIGEFYGDITDKGVWARLND